MAPFSVAVRGQIRSLRILDWIALAAVFAIVPASGALFWRNAGAPREVQVQSDEGQFVYPLGVNRIVTMEGPLGETVIQIHDSRVRVLSDPGPQQICVNQGEIAQPGQWLACLPSHVFVAITGAPDPDAVDAGSF